MLRRLPNNSLELLPLSPPGLSPPSAAAKQDDPAQKQIQALVEELNRRDREMHEAVARSQRMVEQLEQMMAVHAMQKGGWMPADARWGGAGPGAGGDQAVTEAAGGGGLGPWAQQVLGMVGAGAGAGWGAQQVGGNAAAASLPGGVEGQAGAGSAPGSGGAVAGQTAERGGGAGAAARGNAAGGAQAAVSGAQGPAGVRAGAGGSQMLAGVAVPASDTAAARPGPGPSSAGPAPVAVATEAAPRHTPPAKHVAGGLHGAVRHTGGHQGRKPPHVKGTAGPHVAADEQEVPPGAREGPGAGVLGRGERAGGGVGRGGIGVREVGVDGERALLEKGDVRELLDVGAAVGAGGAMESLTAAAAVTADGGQSCCPNLL